MPNLYTPNFLYRTAKEYYRIGTIAAGQFMKNYFEDPYSYCKIQAPAVNISFALELSLKAILLHELGKPPRGHIFLKLYQHIPNQAKTKITGYFGSTLAMGSEFPIIRYKKVQSNEDGEKHNFKTIEEILHAHQDAYNDWRYAHEFSIKENEILDFNFSAMVRVTSACFQYLENDILE